MSRDFPIRGSRRCKLVISFHGGGYHGWRSAHNGRGVEDQLRAALGKLCGSSVEIVASSRTDSGVHALGLAAHVDFPPGARNIPAAHLALALNALLPADVRVISAAAVGADFHARFSAREKEYRYHIWNHPAENPLRTHDAWHVPRPLDLAAMRRAARDFPGTRDFLALTSRRGAPPENPVRTLTACRVTAAGNLIAIRISGGGFLYKMCRAIAGTLVEIGKGNLSSDAVPALIAGRDRQAVPMNAPAHGLTLWRVRYR